MRRGALLIAALLSALAGSGCLRFGYGERAVKIDDAGADASAGRGGASVAGTGGEWSVAAGSGGGGRGGADASESDAGLDAGTDAMPSDAGLDAAVMDSGADAGSDAGTIEVPDAGSDAGAMNPDAGAADSGPPTVYPGCPEQAGVLFCDGFEDPGFSRWGYPVSHNGALERTTARKRTGMASLLATTNGPSALSEARRAAVVLDHQMSGDAWLRFYNYVPSSVTVNQHFSVGIISETAMPYDGFELRILPSGVDINSSSGVFPGVRSFPRDRWVCVELHVLIDPAKGRFEAFLDGLPAVQSSEVKTLPADGMSVAEIGIHYAGANQGPVQVYVDDVAIARFRVGCD
jgi:hypothetical protein